MLDLKNMKNINCMHMVAIVQPDLNLACAMIQASINISDQLVIQTFVVQILWDWKEQMYMLYNTSVQC